MTFFSWKLPIHLNLHSSLEKMEWVFSFLFFFFLLNSEKMKKILFTKAVQYDLLKAS